MRTWNSPVVVSNSRIEPPSVSESCTARVTIVVRTRCGLEAGADRFADLAERTELADRARQLGLAPLQLLHEMHVLNRHRALRGKRAEKPYGALIERLDREPPQQEDTDDLLRSEHRHSQHRPLATELAGLVPLVGRIGEDIVDLHDAALESDPPDECSRASRRSGDRQ